MVAVAVRAYRGEDVPRMRVIWNEVVRSANAFPQIEELADDDGAAKFFAGQTYCGVAEDPDADGGVAGMYILHPNNVGRCAHTANASYAVASECRGRGVGRALVQDSLGKLAPCGFRGLQFNAVVASNTVAIKLYESLGFTRIGMIPGGFRNGAGDYEDMIIFHHPA